MKIKINKIFFLKAAKIISNAIIKLKELKHSIITIDLLNAYLQKNGHFNLNTVNHLEQNIYIQSEILKPKISRINNSNIIQNKIVKIIQEHNLQSTYTNNHEKIINIYIQENKNLNNLKKSLKTKHIKSIHKIIDSKTVKNSIRFETIK